jgi:hypothetical protein
MSEHDSGLLLPNQLVGSDQPIQGIEQNQTWPDWCAIIRALAKGRDICREASRSNIASTSTAIPFCTTIGHLRADVAVFPRQRIEAQHPDGDTPCPSAACRSRLLLTSAIEVTCNCALISEELKTPSIGGVILLRPTKSLALHLQQIGRQRTVILDRAGSADAAILHAAFGE